MDEVYRIEGVNINRVKNSNLIQLVRMPDDYLNLSGKGDLNTYKSITSMLDYKRQGLYIDENKEIAIRFVEVDSIPKDYNKVENESEN